jgi:hypothetical protein
MSDVKYPFPSSSVLTQMYKYAKRGALSTCDYYDHWVTADKCIISVTGTTTWRNRMIVPVTSNKLLVRPRSRGGLGERPAPYPHRSADPCDLTAMTRHVERPLGVHGARLLPGSRNHPALLLWSTNCYPVSIVISIQEHFNLIVQTITRDPQVCV